MEILRYVGKNKNYIKLYEVKCECGKIYVTRYDTLKRGLNKCRPCSARQNGKESAKHNMSYSDTYKTWQSMTDRCKTHQYYISSGIQVCEKWKDFTNFYNDMGKRPSKQHTIDRIDNSKNYYPQNCRWATWKEQNRNVKSNRCIEYIGMKKTIAEWAEIYKKPYHVIRDRVFKWGWDVHKAFTQPVAYRRPRNHQ